MKSMCQLNNRICTLSNRQHLPCFYRVIETRGEVCEKRKIARVRNEHDV